MRKPLGAENIKIIFFDIDGTLFDHAIKDWDRISLEDIKRLKEDGIQVVVASARPFDSLALLGTFDLGFEWDGVIASAGGYVSYQGKIIYLQEFPKDLAKRFSDEVIKDRLSAEAIMPESRILVAPANAEAMKYYSDFYESAPEVRKYQGETITGFNFYAPPEFDGKYRALFPDIVYSRYLDNAVDVFAYPRDKGNAVSMLLSEAGLRKEEAISFGDGEQDVPMGASTAAFIAMGNSKDAIKEQAFFVTETVHEHGVHKALSEFGLIKYI